MELKNINKILAKKAVYRANSGFHFIDECLRLIHRGGTDAAYSRSLYILFSFNFELLLKSLILLVSNEKQEKELMQKIKSHNLETLSKKLSTKDLEIIDVLNIKKRENAGFCEYYIKLKNGEDVIIQDLIDVRYDFEKNILRSSDQNEADRMRKENEVFLSATNKIMQILEKS